MLHLWSRLDILKGLQSPIAIEIRQENGQELS